MTAQKKSSKPAFEMEKEAIREEIQAGIKAGVDKLSGKADKPTREESFHNTKYLLKQYRRIAYAVRMSETELNLRMEMAHGMSLSTFEINADLAGIDLSNTKLEGYVLHLFYRERIRKPKPCSQQAKGHLPC